ncbi:MAG: helix-turn-helix domain-containing protein [Ktedonobacteraceae bacterium]
MSTCSTAPLASAEAHAASRRARELERLLSPWAASQEVSLAALGKRFDFARQQRRLTIAEIAQRVGEDGREVLAIEYGNGTREATFRDYLRYADALDLSLQEVFDAGRFPEPLSQCSEEGVLGQVEAAIHQLQAQGEPVLHGKIGALVGIRVSQLQQYPRVKTVLQRSKLKRSHETVGLDHQREDGLLKRVEQAIKQVEFLGKPVTQQRICHIVGMTYSWLIRYPRVKVLLLRIAYNRQENVTRRRHREEQELMRQVEQAITQLESRGEPVTAGQICELLGVSRERLNKHQRVKTLVSQYNGNSPEGKQRVRRREEELVNQVEQAMAHLVSLGDSVTQWRVCKAVGLSQRHLECYPRVKVLLDHCKGKRHRRRSRVEQHEKVLLKQMEQALQQLEAAGESVLPRTVAMMIHLPLQRLDDYPLIKARFQQVLDEYNRNQAWRWQQREEEAVGRLHQAIQTLEARGKAVTQHALLALAQLTLAQANKYPRVKSLLEKVQTAKRGALHE